MQKLINIKKIQLDLRHAGKNYHLSIRSNYDLQQYIIYIYIYAENKHVDEQRKLQNKTNKIKSMSQHKTSYFLHNAQPHASDPLWHCMHGSDATYSARNGNETQDRVFVHAVSLLEIESAFNNQVTALKLRT
jgi:hypothetical protein